MIQAWIIDDEYSSLQSLKIEIGAYCPQVIITETFNDPIKALDFIREPKNIEPELVFLDIEMPGLDGFGFLQALEEIKFDVIFITAYDQFAIKAFEVNAIDYLLKPIIKQKLVDAVDKVINKHEHSLAPDDFEALIQSIQRFTKHGFEKIALPTPEGFEFVHINEIAYLKAESNYTWVFLVEGKKYLISKTLKEISIMIEFPQFYRVHKSYFVNLNHALKYIRGSGGYLVMHDQSQIPVSRAQKVELLKKLNY